MQVSLHSNLLSAVEQVLQGSKLFVLHTRAHLIDCAGATQRCDAQQHSSVCLQFWFVHVTCRAMMASRDQSAPEAVHHDGMTCCPAQMLAPWSCCADSVTRLVTDAVSCRQVKVRAPPKLHSMAAAENMVSVSVPPQQAASVLLRAHTISAASTACAGCAHFLLQRAHCRRDCAQLLLTLASCSK
jgi:hypothetical protein